MILHFGTSTSKYQSGKYEPKKPMSELTIALIITLFLSIGFLILKFIIKGIIRLER